MWSRLVGPQPEMKKRIRIAVDATGGDYAPGEVIRGAVAAARERDVDVILVGPMEVLEAEVRKNGGPGAGVRCVPATEAIKEGESPASAVRRKPNSSVVVATKLVKSGEADAVVSAGPSGATAVSAVQHLGMLEGMERPAIGGTLGSFAPGVLLMDLGANVDSKPYHLVSFAVAGSVYARKFLKISSPTVGLLSTGAEEGKGNELVREAYALLKESGLNFIGNVEGSDILKRKANVIVCDGFVGNVLLKFYESVGDRVYEWIREKLRRHPPLRALARLTFDRLFPISKMSYEGEMEGSGILWGVNGVVRIAHGACRASHILHGIASARNAVELDVVGSLKEELARLRTEAKV